MPTDDREQQFERALTRHLRDASPDANCPDAETLAAYHERTLSLDEMARWKEHVGGCLRCQEALAVIEQSEEVHVEEWQDEGVPVGALQVLAQPATRAGSELAPQETVLLSAAAAEPVTFTKPRPRLRWRWAVPIGALAASVIVWVGFREIQMQHRNATQGIQMAKNQQAPPQLAPPASELREPLREKEAPASQSSSDLTRQQEPVARLYPKTLPPSEAPIARPGGVPQAPADELAFSKQENSGAAALKKAVPPRAAVTASANAPVSRDTKSAPQPQTGSGIAGGVAGGVPANALAADVRQAAEEAAAVNRLTNSNIANLSVISGTVLDPSGATIGGALVTAINASNGSTRSVIADATGNFQLTGLPNDQYRLVVSHAGFAQSEQTLTLQPSHHTELVVRLNLASQAQSVEVAGSAPSLSTETAETSVAVNSSSARLGKGRNFALVQLASSNPRYIVSPGEKYAWRVGDGGKIERSPDGGKSWKQEKSGVTADLTTGSATSDKVCWVIGKTGTILLSTDGGKHWKQITSPISGDLGGIHATDAAHASIWDVPNRNSFQTSDGGVTWKRIANE